MSEVAKDDDQVATFLQDLRYRVEPIDWSIDDLPPGAQRFVRRFRLMCHYPDAVSPFQVFHIELHDYGTRYLAIRAVLDPFYRASPQGNYLFVLSLPSSSVLTLVNPKPAGGLLTPVRYRTLRVIPNALSPFPRRIVESLRLLPGEQSAGAEQIAEKHRRTFDALQHLRRREREEIVELDPYRLFLDDLQSYPVLPHEEQLRLVRQIRSGSLDADAARDKLVVHNQRLVIHMAWRYQRRGLELVDLIQEGTLGLLRAIDTFDPDHGAQFSTYAVHWIRQAIQRAIADHGRLVRLPAHLHERVIQLEQTRKVLRDVFDREPSDTEVALKVGLLSPQETALGWLNLIMGWSPSPPLRKRLCKATTLVTRVRQWARQTLSLDLSLPNEGISTAGDLDETEPDDRTVADVIPDNATSLLDLAVRQSLREEMQAAVARLDDRQRLVLELRFGLKDGQERTLEEVGELLHVTRERVRQIESKAMRILPYILLELNFIEAIPVRCEEDGSYEEIIQTLSVVPPPQPQVATSNDSEFEEWWLSLSPSQQWAEIVAALRCKPGDQPCHQAPASVTTYLDCLDEPLEPDDWELFNDD